jgi:hypothetical protein
MKKRYRRAGRQPLVLAIAFVLGNAAGIWAAVKLGPKLGAGAFLVTVVIILASLCCGYAFLGLKSKGRHAAIGRVLQGRAMAFDRPPTTDSFGPFTFLKEWGGWESWIASKQMKWLARNEDSLLMEREYTTGSDEVYQDHRLTIGVVLDGDCGQLKGMRLVRKGGDRSKGELGGDPFDLEWVTAREHDVPAERNVSAATKAALSNCPMGESWYFWDGWAICEFDGFLDEQNIALFADHLEEVVNSLRGGS